MTDSKIIQQKCTPGISEHVNQLVRDGFHLVVAAEPAFLPEILRDGWKIPADLQHEVEQLHALIITHAGKLSGDGEGLVHLAVEAAIKPHIPLPDEANAVDYMVINPRTDTLLHCHLDEPTNGLDPVLTSIPAGMAVLGQTIVPTKPKEERELGTGADPTALGSCGRGDLQDARNKIMTETYMLPHLPAPKSPTLPENNNG